MLSTDDNLGANGHLTAGVRLSVITPQDAFQTLSLINFDVQA